ncbi:hypothetical protein MMC32_008494 [Xylographa parallela]|nr:hypothetical protein [Xylographa parallela]
MAESIVPKLHHALKDQHDKRTPTEFGAEKEPSDPDFKEKPTMAVCKGAELKGRLQEDIGHFEQGPDRSSDMHGHWPLQRLPRARRSSQSLPPARNPYHQLADLEMFIELLMPLRQNLQNKKMNVFMQDPSFNELDEAFLRSRGFHILKHPEAYNRMTPATFLYAPGNHDDVVYHANRVAEPALFIANDVAAFGECNGFPNRNN